jgi:hypothetical protein
MTETPFDPPWRWGADVDSQSDAIEDANDAG